MPELALVSAQPGVGRTRLAACLAALSGQAVLADCDFRGGGLTRIARAELRFEREHTTGRGAHVPPEICVGCGRCAEACPRGAVTLSGPPNELIAKTYQVDPARCNGCAICGKACPQGGIAQEPVARGRWMISDSPLGPVVHAEAEVAPENSGKWISQVRRQARCESEEVGREWVMVDGPCGLSCPLVEAIAGASFVLAVAVPEVPGMLPFGRLLSIAQHLGVPAGACVNRWDQNAELSRRLETIAKARGVPVVGRVSSNPAAVADFDGRLAAGGSLVEGVPADVHELWDRLGRLLTSATPSVEPGLRGVAHQADPYPA